MEPAILSISAVTQPRLILQRLAGSHRCPPLIENSFEIVAMNGRLPAGAGRLLHRQPRIFHPAAIHERTIAVGPGNKRQGRHGFHRFAKFLFLPQQFSHPELIKSPEQCQESSRAEGAEPPGVPPRWQYPDMKRNPLLIPDSIIIGGLDAKRIVAGVEMRVRGKTTRGIGVLPVPIKPIEFIGVPVFLWGGEIQCRELEAKDRLTVAESEARRDMDGLPERRILAADFHRLVEQLKLRQHHRRRGWIINKLAGIKGA